MSEKLLIVSCPNCNKKVRIPADKHLKFECPECHEEVEIDDQSEKVENEKSTEKPMKEFEEEPKDGFSFFKIIRNTIAILLIIPLYIILHKSLPDPDWFWNVDRFLIFVVLLGIILYILENYRSIAILIFVLSFGFLTYGSIQHKYGFVSLFSDYKDMVVQMSNAENPEQVLISKVKPFTKKGKFITAIEFDSASVRDFAIASTKKHFHEFQKSDEREFRHYRNTIQCLAVFKEINSRWEYVNDPVSREYIAPATETLKYLSGDCDDHSVFMAAAIKSIGGVVRLVRTENHIYPELLIGDRNDLEKIEQLIKTYLFRSESRNAELCYHEDNNDRVWLNLDYMDNFPGGKFSSDVVLEVLEL
ncbi:hypothetical protein [Saccharicrinis sp. FJH54]|uniref:hypothetical protein n=1 Tax=Saccharicrinis sp. FJH54 TaxID=3344665 RepID=UPI0035D3DC3D